HPRLGALGHVALVDPAELDAQQRSGQQRHEGEDRQHHQDGATHDTRGQRVPEAAVGLRRGPVPPAAAEDAALVDPRAEQVEQGRQHHQGREHRHSDGGHDAVGDAVQEGHLDQQEAAHGQDDDQARDHDGAPGGGHGAEHRRALRPNGGRLGAVVLLDLLAEAPQHEQRVVDGHAQADDGDDVGREDGDLGELGDDAGDGEPAEDRHTADEQREGGGDQGPEDEDHDDQQERHRDHLGEQEVLLDLRVDVVEDGRTAAEGDLEPSGVAGLAQVRFHGGVEVGQLVLGGASAEADRGEGGAPVVRDERLGAGVVIGGDGVDAVEAPHLLDRAGHGGLELGVVHRQVLGGVEDHDIGADGAELGFDGLGGGHRVRFLRDESAVGELVEDAQAPGGADGEDRDDADDDDPSRLDDRAAYEGVHALLLTGWS